MNEQRAVPQWLAPVSAALPELTEVDLQWLDDFESDLTGLLGDAPPRAAYPARWVRWLLAVRRQLAARHPEAAAVAATSRALRRTLAQFVCGFHDLDLRDAYGPGHGALILTGAEPGTRARWRARLAAGALVGIAATELRGGSRLKEITTSARRISNDRWMISGQKCWVSRLTEASGLVVFFADPDRRLSAAVIDADRPGLVRELRQPAGLAGWSWGVLRLHEVAIDPGQELLGGPGEGERLFRRHFAGFRPLVAATALGAAASVHSMVAATLHERLRTGVLSRVRDNALILLGRAHAELSAALLSTVAISRLAATGAVQADLWARIGKAYAVDTAYRAVADLAPLVGAEGFQAESSIAKARADLTALLYADGIHDSLYRSGGISLLSGYAVGRGRPPDVPSIIRADFDRAA